MCYLTSIGLNFLKDRYSKKIQNNIVEFNIVVLLQNKDKKNLGFFF